MAETTAAPAAAPAAAAKPAPAGKPSSSGGTGKAWSMAALVTALVLLNVLGILSGQINTFLQVVKFNAGALMGIGAFALFMSMKKK